MNSPPPPPPHPPQSGNNGLATCSLICGIAGLLAGLLTGIAAIITGHMALGQIKRAGGVIGGRGMALTGVILGWVTTGLSLLVLAAALVTPVIFKSLRRAEMANSVSNAMEIKFALDSFAMDFDGVYPNDDSADWLQEGGLGTDYSNDYFRQLVFTANIPEERPFWCKGSMVVSRTQPDEITTRGGKPVLEEILQAGDVHWAYVTDQTNTSDPSRPLILDSYVPGTTEFDADLWNMKVIVVQIDGSARPMRIDAGSGRVLDHTGHDILSPQAEAWQGSGEDPASLLKQPEP